jgi:alpha-amylase
VYGAEGSLQSDGAGRLTITVPALSAVVYRAERHVPRSRRAPDVSLRLPGPYRDRLQVAAEVDGDSFYEVTFLARQRGRWRAIGTDDNAPYRVFHDVADVRPGTRIEYKAVVLDNAGHKRTSRARSATVAPPAITLTAPREGSHVRGGATVVAEVVPEHATDVVVFERQIGSGPWERVGTDSSSPVYTLRDAFSTDLPTGTIVRYRATLNGRVTSDVRSVTVRREVITTAIVHYNRSGGDYGTVADGWGLHLWGAAIGVPETMWGDPFERTGIDSFGAVYAIPIRDDTQPVNFIMHLPNGDSVPTTREPGGDRSFVPIDHPEIWLKQGDPTVHFSEPQP